MAFSNFIPTLWSTKLLTALRNELVFAQDGVINRDYEGEVSNYGDSVKINMISDPTIFDYTRYGDITAPEELTGAQALLLIDQAKGFNFMVDDVDQAQMNISIMNQAMQNAAYKLKVAVDTKVSTDMAAAVTSANTIGTTGTPKTISAATDVYNYIVDLGVLLDQNNIPENGRWIIVPPWFEGYLLKDIRFAGSGAALADTRLLNGFLRQVAGFNVLKSNTVPVASTTYKILAGSSMAYTYADQVAKIEAFRPERKFVDAMKGLHVYGGKVIRPESLVELIITRP